MSIPNQHQGTTVSYRFASSADIALVRWFIDSHWRRGHVLARDERLLAWQHQGPNDRLNFVLGERGGETVGLLGFIDSSRFDPDDLPGSVSLTTWVTRSDVPTTGVGIGMLRFLERERRPALVSTIGVAVDAQRLLGALGYETGEMEHRVILNPTQSSWGVAQVGTGHLGMVGSAFVSNDVRAVRGRIGQWEFDYTDLLSRHAATVVPRKSLAYLEARFADHPAYGYWTITLMSGDQPACLLVCRTIEVGKTIVARCVDKVGELAVEGSPGALQRLVVELGVEYLDFVCHRPVGGLDLPDGFLVSRADSGFWVPGFFEPYRCEPRTLRYAARSRTTVQDVELWMADSDQDRPNETGSRG